MTTRSESDTIRARADDALRQFETATGLQPGVGGVLAVTVLALVLRIVGLGGRIAHFDEARVAYWTLEYLETGAFHYRFIIHGPFVQHVNRVVFAVFGANDFTMRLVVAVIGGLLPLVVLLFRERLRDVELVAAAVFLAVNPILLYYSRFFRSTILVAGFMTAALGALVRLADTRRARWLSVATLFAALGFAAKENAVVYVLCFLGGGALLADYALLDPRNHDRGSELLRAKAGWMREVVTDADGRETVARWAGHVGIATGVFLVVTLFFYAPRAPGEGVGLWSALLSPGQFPALIDATVADIDRGLRYWFGGASEPNCSKETVIAGWVCFLERTVGVLTTYAAPLLVFAVLGFLIERYATERPRPLVMLASYWGFVSVLGYPLGTDIFGAWITVNALVPLAVPAGVGAATIARWGYEALPARRSDAALAGVILLLAGAQVAVTAGSAVYAHPAGQVVEADNDIPGEQLENTNGLVQFAQPAGNFRPVVAQMRRIAPANEGTDVLIYGDRFVVSEPGSGGGLVPTCTVFVRTLPLHWYLRMSDAQATCAFDQGDLDQKLQDPPPIVIAPAGAAAEDVAERLDGYERSTYALRSNGRETVFFVDRSLLNGTA
ncbi:MAG: flippase activity-associated protein Agl23 [Halobaculum sp.]